MIHDPTLPRRVTILAIAQLLLVPITLLIGVASGRMPLVGLESGFGGLVICCGALTLIFRSSSTITWIVAVDMAILILAPILIDSFNGNLSGAIWVLTLIWPPAAILVLRRIMIGVGLAIFAAGVLIVTAVLQLNALLPTRLDIPQDIFVLHIAILVVALIALVAINVAISRRERQALEEAQRAQQDLHLQVTHVERLLAEQDRLNSELRGTLDENRRQHEIIREVGAPLLPVRHDTLVMPLVGEFSAARLLDAEMRTLEALRHNRTHRLLIDLTGLSAANPEVAAGIARLVQTAQLLGAQVALVGVTPSVAVTLVSLQLDGLPTFRDLQSALQIHE